MVKREIEYVLLKIDRAKQYAYILEKDATGLYVKEVRFEGHFTNNS